MSPFDVAQAAGYGKNDILKFIAKANPMMSQALSVALQNGYSSDQVFQYLGKAMAGAKVDSKVSQKVFGDPNAANVMRQAQNAPFEPSTKQMGAIGGLAGAAVGGLVGGVPGAVAGAGIGYKQLDNLSKAYEQHVQSGGKIPFSDFLMKLAQGVTLAGIGANAVGPLAEMATEYLKGAGKEVPEDEGQTAQEVVKDQKHAPIQTEQQPQPLEGVLEEREGVESRELSSPVRNRLMMLNRQIDSLREKGVPEDSKRMQKLRERKENLLSGEGLGLVEQEIDRFEKGYGVQEPSEPMPEANANAFTEIFQKSMPESQEFGAIQKSIKPLENSLKSSNVVGAFYDGETNKMRTIFRSGEGYEYENISLDELEKVTGGKAQPITEGSSQYGFWFPDKKKSVGAAFSKFIKKKSEDFPYRKLEKSELNPNEEQLSDAVRTFNVSGLFEPFKVQRKKGQQMEKGKVLRDMEPVLKGMDDDFLQEIVQLLEEQVALKTPIKMTRLQKEFRKEFL